MPTITLEDGGLTSFFMVPKAVESHLSTASHDELKALLGLLACSGQTLDEEVFAERLGMSRQALLDAVKYWVGAGILVKRGGALRLAAAEAGVSRGELPHYPAETISLRAERDEALAQLLSYAEQILGKLLSPSDISSLFAMYDWLGLPADVIMMLLEYCRQNGSTGMRYIEKCALSWADEGIDTFEKAEYKLRLMEKRRQAESRIVSLFGIGGRALTKKEKEYIDRWVNEMQMSFELIGAAYEEAVNSTGKLSFPYINKVLQAWHEQGVKTPQEAQSLPRKKGAGKRRAGPDGESAYDNDSFLKPSWELLE